MTMCCQTSSLLIEQKLLNNVSCGFDDKSKSPTSSISVTEITRCISQIDYLSNLKANNDVIISSLEKTVEFDIDEEKYVIMQNRSDFSLSPLFLIFYLSVSWLAIYASSVLYQIQSDRKTHKMINNDKFKSLNRSHY